MGLYFNVKDSLAPIWLLEIAAAAARLIPTAEVDFQVDFQVDWEGLCRFIGAGADGR